MQRRASQTRTSIPRRATVFVTGCAFLVLAAAPVHADDAAAAPLFDGQTLAGWETLEGEPVTRGWEVVDGTIHLLPSEERAGHIVTSRDVGNFVLTFEFKIAPRGNSGIKYRVRNFGDKVLGCEYQIYDDDHPEHPVEPKNSTGSLYDVYEPVADKPLRPAGQYNTARIVVVNNVIEHWLNGHRILRAVAGSREWRCRIAASKFNDAPGFGLNRFGKIMLTDHGSEVWYRNLQLIELPTDPCPPPRSLAATGARPLRSAAPSPRRDHRFRPGRRARAMRR